MPRPQFLGWDLEVMVMRLNIRRDLGRATQSYELERRTRVSRTPMDVMLYSPSHQALND